MGAASHVQAALAIVDAGKAGVIGEDRSMSVRTLRIIAWLLLAAYTAAYWYWYWRILHGNVAREALIYFLVLSVGVLAVVVKLLRVDKRASREWALQQVARRKDPVSAVGRFLRRR